MLNRKRMVGVAQSAELRVVAPVVAGSSPVAHPSTFKYFRAIGGIQWPFFVSVNCSRGQILAPAKGEIKWWLK